MHMKKIGYGAESFIYVGWIFCVMAIFKIVTDKPTAGTIAGIGFVLLPLFFLYIEMKVRDKRNYLHAVVLLVFLLSSALPIILLRILNQGVPFDSIELLGITGPQLHKISNYTYMLMLFSSAGRFLYLRFKK